VTIRKTPSGLQPIQSHVITKQISEVFKQVQCFKRQESMFLSFHRV